MERAPLLIPVSHSPRPIGIPRFIPGLASQGYMALNVSQQIPSVLQSEYKVYGRGVPENTIFKAKLYGFKKTSYLVNPETVLSPKMYPRTSDGQLVLGYEDPTVLPPKYNPVNSGQEGIFCTQTISKNGVDDKNGLFARLVYFEDDPAMDMKVLRLVASPHDIGRDLGYTNNEVDMVKEAEVDEYGNILAEYADGKHSHILIGRVENGKLVAAKSFYTAEDDNSQHVSTLGSSILLENELRVLFYNRSRGNEWGINYMRQERPLDIDPLARDRDWLLRADTKLGRGPGNQLIDFGSCVMPCDGGRGVIILSHINDNRPWETVYEVNRKAL